ncbi:MAG: hypothetical protein WC780_13620 [Lentimicrobiaceae bacterium]|jgi:hypothetical protein
MKDNQNNRNLPVKQAGKEEKENLIGYPASPAGEDIYNKYQEERDINPEDISKSKALNENDQVDLNHEKNFITDVPGSDLDVPGSELDDEMEKIGSEDEENNYYSLGGDDHNDLDENQ